MDIKFKFEIFYYNRDDRFVKVRCIFREQLMYFYKKEILLGDLSTRIFLNRSTVGS